MKKVQLVESIFQVPLLDLVEYRASFPFFPHCPTVSWGWLLALQQAFFPDFVTQYKLYVLLSERQGVIFTKGNLLWTRSHSFKIKPYLDLTFYFFSLDLKLTGMEEMNRI